MKLLSQKTITYQLIRAKKMQFRSFRKRKRKRKHHIIRVSSRIKVIAPETLNLFTQNEYASFIEFITIIRDHVYNGEQILIDFLETKSIKICALTVLYAHIDFFQKLTKNKKVIALTRCKTSRLNNWFKVCGLWKLTRHNNCNPEISNSMEIVSAVAGLPPDSDEAALVKSKIRNILIFIRDTIYDGRISPEENNNLYAALTESISNVGLHAYSNDKLFLEFITEIGKRWWILAHKVEDQLFLIIYDMGEGIPITLVRRNFFSLIQQMFNPETDSDKISAAIKYGETRMQSDKHGKGLTDIKRYVEDNPKGELHIFSGMGRYSYHTNSGQVETTDLPYSIGGTLIQWNINLRGQE
ncbi:hypothetical protein [Ignatzschineria cameli]|uniref:ATP-binding protein n=1 Tax=Ignatzschineria cameli TaxID=2182793 RepID=A0A2U2AR49_9GAMM|nr:hypothetical protein [Ignatzschineria cameli]PWD86339.1 hypothetical protein DC077_06260 [Ignatzschineria cameli]PWD89823.1 hypothetical protein DC079_05670 [Ignatzschineria cameli]PWD91473.1 hypothetical protein DC081_05380 [Ignatzschineria cameli]PWD92511.1 hypothetical protein DC078_05665 [Ignatzschineria cameli]